MNNSLIEILGKADIGRNFPATTINISKTNIALKEKQWPMLPKDFQTILLNYNGLSNEGAIMLGIEEGNNFFPNLLEYNSFILTNKHADFLILGYDDFFYMIFDTKDNKYKIVDQDDFSEIVSSEDIGDSLSYLLSFDYE